MTHAAARSIWPWWRRGAALFLIYSPIPRSADLNVLLRDADNCMGRAARRPWEHVGTSYCRGDDCRAAQRLEGEVGEVQGGERGCSGGR